MKRSIIVLLYVLVFIGIGSFYYYTKRHLALSGTSSIVSDQVVKTVDIVTSIASEIDTGNWKTATIHDGAGGDLIINHPSDWKLIKVGEEVRFGAGYNTGT